MRVTKFTHSERGNMENVILDQGKLFLAGLKVVRGCANLCLKYRHSNIHFFLDFRYSDFRWTYVITITNIYFHVITRQNCLVEGKNP